MTAARVWPTTGAAAAAWYVVRRASFLTANAFWEEAAAAAAVAAVKAMAAVAVDVSAEVRLRMKTAVGHGPSSLFLSTVV